MSDRTFDPMRNYPDWLLAYCDYASFTEAPRRMHFWSGVSAIAGALRRRVWLDMKSFKWYTNHYIILVAPPGIVSKTTTISIATSLLRSIPGIKFGPEVVTWPALVTSFAEANEQFDATGQGDWMAQCALTLESGEFGNLINPQDREMIDLLVTLWDAKQGAFNKKTKHSGSDTVENPWINLIACTTPAWIAGNFPEYVIGGGFTSRCVFVHCDTKEKLVALPDEAAPENFDQTQEKLRADLEYIAQNLVGRFKIAPDAREWTREWYKAHYANPPEHLHDERFAGYLARKQTHLFKLAMILSVSRGDSLTIEVSDLVIGLKMLKDLEEDMPKVFSKIGRSEASIHAERFVRFVHSRGAVPYEQAYNYVHLHFPNFRDFEGIVNGAIRSGQIMLEPKNGQMLIKAAVPTPTPQQPKPPSESSS